MLSYHRLNKSLLIILFLFFVHLVFLHHFFRQGVPETHDGDLHMARFATYKKAFIDFHIPPRWAKDLNYTYGLPELNFFYPVSGYIATMLSLLGVSYEVIFKLLLSISFLIAPIGMFFFLSLLSSRINAILGAFLFGLAPYQFLNMYVRGALGEILSISIVPFALYFLTMGIQKKALHLFILGGIISSLIILTHHGVGLMTFPFFIAFLCFMIWKYKTPFSYMLMYFILTLGISAFFWIPAFFESKYTHAALFFGNIYKEHFISPLEMILKSWGFAPNPNEPDGQSPQIGLVGAIILIISIVSLIKRKQLCSLTLLIVLTLFICYFLPLSISSPVWENIKILKLYQFPWRFIGLASILLPIFVSLSNITKKPIILFFLILSLVAQAFLYIPQKNIIHRENNWYENFQSTTAVHGESTPIWTDGLKSSYPKQYIEIIEGVASGELTQRKTQQIETIINAQTDANIRFNTLYYPGWKAYINNQETPIEFQDPNHKGIITVRVPKGLHIVILQFEETKLRMVANIITIGSVMFAIGSFLWIRKRYS